MILAFDTEELRTICEDSDAARSTLGGEVADVLRLRLADLRAADLVDDLLVGRPTPVGDGGHQLEVELVTGVHMKFVPNHVRSRVNDDGATDWTRVRRIRLIGIGGSR